MNLDKDAIQHIQELGNIPEIIKQITDNKSEELPVAVIPASMRLESLETFMPNAARFRFDYRTSVISDFVAYSEIHDQEGAGCFVNPDKMSAFTIYDLGTNLQPKHQQNKARLTLKKTAAFSALGQITDRPLTQKEAGEFIQDWSDHMTVFTKHEEEMHISNAAHSLQNLTIEAAREVSSSVDDFGESMSGMERIEAKNQDVIPASIKFTCVPYNELDERDFILRVSILTGDSKPKISLRVIRLESIQEEMAVELKDRITSATEELLLKTFIGEV